MPVRHRRSNRRRASRARNNISIASPPPGLGRRAPPRPTVERMISCSPVSFNDIKHLARSMPADGLEAQDVVPPRCGCWVAHIAIFSSRRSVFGQSTHARAPREISPEFSSAVRRPPVRGFLMIWRAVFEALGSCSGRRGTGRQIAERPRSSLDALSARRPLPQEVSPHTLRQTAAWQGCKARKFSSASEPWRYASDFTQRRKRVIRGGEE